MTTRLAGRIVAAALAVLCVVLAWTAVVGAMAARDLSRARDLLSTTQGRADLAALAQAEGLAEHAEGLLRQPGPLLSQALPVVGRTTRAARIVAESGAATIGSARSAARVLDQKELVRDGKLDLEAVREFQQVLDAAALAMGPPLQRLAEVDPTLLPGPVARRVREAQGELLGADAKAARAAALTEALPGILGADQTRTVLVVLQNNAELRGTGGLISTFTVGTAQQGALVLEPFRDVIDVADPPEEVQRVTASPEYVEQYGPFLANTTLWKNANMSPDGPSSNSVLAAVASSSLGRNVDVVLSLDVRAMTSIAATLGSVALEDGTQLTAEQLADELYVRSYEGLEFSGLERRRELRAAADVALRRVLAGESAPEALVRQLTAAVEGRHLTLWSANPAEQALLVEAGAAGVVDTEGGDVSMVTVHNLGGPAHLQGGGPGEGNKLDYYVRRKLSISTVLGPDGTADVTQRLELANTAPEGLGPYVAGFTVPGRVTELVSLYAHGNAELQSLTKDGQTQTGSVSSELGARVVRTVTELDRNASATWELRYRVPLDGRSYRLRLVPQPLARDASVQVTVSGAPGVEVESGNDGKWTEGGVAFEERFTEIRDVNVRVAAPRTGLAERIRSFWSSPAGT
ncbi:MAG: DUF4012 domain-containing protein [Actinobacteria bacterium]|nr:DUF4012 domain-containing protein [Actinomycetota bacterium]MBW3646752.1 DUF4012 domain-containing protein [Actinomycetota bacterium]